MIRISQQEAMSSEWIGLSDMTHMSINLNYGNLIKGMPLCPGKQNTRATHERGVSSAPSHDWSGEPSTVVT